MLNSFIISCCILKVDIYKLYEECINRGFNVQNYINAWDNVPNELMNDYKANRSRQSYNTKTEN